MKKCKHCKLEFDLTDKSKGWMANHSRWCTFNPKRESYAKNPAAIEAMKKKRQETGYLNQYSKAKLEGKEIVSKLKGRPGISRNHTDETKNKMREKAIASNHRRLVRSIREYVRKDGTAVMLDSSWEELLAKRLDDLNVDWVRPESMKWIDSQGRSRNYFPDFYLPKYDLLLDPKNPAAMKQQIEKITWLKENVKNLRFLHNEEEIRSFLP